MTRVIQCDQLIGDLLMITPAMRQVKTAFPDDLLFYHVPVKDPRFPISGTHCLLEGNPNLDGVFVGDDLPTLAEGDMTIPLDTYKAYMWAVTNKKTIADGFGHQLGVELENLRYDYCLRPEEVDEMRGLAANLSEGKPLVVIGRHSASCTSNDPKIGLPNKCIPNLVWVQTAKWLLDEGFMPVAVGANREVNDIRYKQWPGKKLYGLSLRELAAFLSLSRAVITIDTGIRHLATAVGTNMACISGVIPLNVIRCEPVRDTQVTSEMLCPITRVTLDTIQRTADPVLGRSK